LIRAKVQSERIAVFASLSWLRPLSKFVLEVNPMICAAAIGAYVLGSVIAQSSAPKPLTLAAPEPFELSGEEITAIVQTAHSAALTGKVRPEGEPRETAEATPQAKAEEPRRAEPKNRIVERKLPARAAAPKPAPRAVETAALAAPLPAPPPPAAITPDRARQERSWYGRTWNAVSGWGGDAAEAVVATPGAVVRAGKRTFEVVTDAVIPGR
jgi:hypothetical protein